MKITIRIEVGRPRLSKRLLVVLVAAFALAVPLAWATHTFPDVPNTSPHHDDVTAIRDAGITSGCNPPANTLYCPDQAVRRDQMASFLHRGFGRATSAIGTSVTNIGSGFGDSPWVDIDSVTISVPGVTGTQFVYLSGEATFSTNSTKATFCANVACSGHLGLFDGETLLAFSFLRLSGDYDGGTIPVSIVVAAPAGAPKTYTLRAKAVDVNTDLAFAVNPRLIAATFPFGGSGGATLTEARVSTSPAGSALSSGKLP